nr:MAG TPA: hypothetical protein [Caudoviricetes sp.]
MCYQVKVKQFVTVLKKFLLRGVVISVKKIQNTLFSTQVTMIWYCLQL